MSDDSKILDEICVMMSITSTNVGNIPPETIIVKYEELFVSKTGSR